LRGVVEFLSGAAFWCDELVSLLLTIPSSPPPLLPYPTGAGQNGGPSLTFKLANKSLLSYIEIYNGGCSSIDVHLGVKKGSHNLVKIVSSKRLARNRLNEVKIGHIPCNYVKIVIKGGAPMSIYQLRLNGIDAGEVGAKMGPR
jgi:hypothetical protein